MSPIENPRNMGEVGIYLRALEEDLKLLQDKDLHDIKVEIRAVKEELRKGREERRQRSESKKLQYTLIFLSSIVSPIIVGLVLIVFKGSV